MVEKIGTDGNDFLEGTSGDDRLCGLSGNDTRLGYLGHDSLDIVMGGQNSVDEGAGDDRLTGGTCVDTLLGAENDMLNAGYRATVTLDGGDAVRRYSSSFRSRRWRSDDDRRHRQNRQLVRVPRVPPDPGRWRTH